MKKQHFILSFVMAAMAMLAVGCQKEEPATVTLGAQIEEAIGGAKAYIDGYTPCWHNGDMVYINDAAYPIVAASGSSARIEGVTTSSNYRAIFPASIVTPNTDISNNSSFPITLPSVQRYELVGNHQQVDVPMGAYLTNGSTLRFYNLCSIVRVTVSNALNQPLPLRHLVLEAENARLSGEGTATVSGDSTNHITMSGTARHAACLGFTTDCPVTVPARGSKTFDIVVPAFARDNVTFTVYTTDDHYFETTKHNVSLWRNCITTVTLNVNQLTQITAAELVSGLNFRDAIPNNATAIVFEYNNPSVTSGTLLSTTNSPVPIYGNLDSDGTTWRISTAARMMNANPYCGWMFSPHWNDGNLPRLETIDFGEGFNTSNATDMSYMFRDRHYLTSLDVSHFVTSNVTNMCEMFAGCCSLRSLDVSNFNTSSVTNMYRMFWECSELASLDVSHFNTSNVTNMNSMFAACRGLKNLDVSYFNTSSVTDMGEMFFDCGELTCLDVSNFNTENVTCMRWMFYRCSGLTSLDVSHFNTENVTTMETMFGDCSGLTSLNISNFNTARVKNMDHLFSSCSGLTSLDVTHFNTDSVIVMNGMFAWCSGLQALDVTNFNTSNVMNMGSMFLGCSGLHTLNLTNFNTSNVTNMAGVFEGCYNLTNLDLSNFDMSDISSKEHMCADISVYSGYCTITCPSSVETAIKEVDPEYDPSNVHEHFYYYITGLPTSGVTFTWVRPTSSK
ncbi:MAG: BspA family leucine-rich repeat surface protein [Bacteroidales bacterium]|nr:BspA family leucine-rich repeat surface protein [Bacteroidales bacterium]